MSDQLPKNYTINFTDEDKFHLLKETFIQLIIIRDHPEVLVRAHELAEQMTKQCDSE